MEKSKQGSQSTASFKGELGDWVESLELQQVKRKVEEFGTEKPLALALAALTVGVAAGLLIRGRAPLS